MQAILEKSKIVSKKFTTINSYKLSVALNHKAYNALEKVFATDQMDIVKVIQDSGLRGKGGGGGGTGDRWSNLWKHNPKGARPSFLVVNADESEPGTFKDREIMDKDPHLLLEGIICSAYALNAHQSYIYIRGEYAQFARRLNEAIAEAYQAGILGKQIKDPHSGKIYDWAMDITVHRGAGAYICGEKTALLESLEGKRGQPRLKPKDKSEPEWFFGYPTIVNNVETISTVPFILKNGADAYRAFGTDSSPGTILMGISGHINNPGIYEAPYGISMWDFIHEIGGGIPSNKKLKAVIPGGSSCQILTAEEAQQCTLDYDGPKKFGSSLGTAGMIIMDETVNMVEAMKNLLEFYHHESC